MGIVDENVGIHDENYDKENDDDSCKIIDIAPKENINPKP